MELNETALRLWEMLEQPQTVEALTDRMAAYYEIPKEEQGELAKDIEAFVQELLVFGAVRGNWAVRREAVRGGCILRE